MLGTISAQRDLLRRSPLFSCLGDKETDAILARANVARYAAGREIFAKGDPVIRWHTDFEYRREWLVRPSSIERDRSRTKAQIAGVQRNIQT